MPRWAVMAVVAFGLGVASMVGQAAGSNLDGAQAYSTAYFCPSSGPTYNVIPAGGRCVDTRRVRHRYVETHIWGAWGSGDFCVGAKANADGTGANTKGFGCAFTSQTSYTYSSAQPSPGAPLGYATIINRTGSSDAFWGYMEWYP